MPNTTQPITIQCPVKLTEALQREANLRGVTVEELTSSLVVTPLKDQIEEITATRLAQLP